MVDRWLNAAGVVALLLAIVLLVALFNATHKLHGGASYTPEGASLSPPTVPQGTELPLPTYHHFTPEAKARQITPAPKPNTVHLAVELTHPTLQHLRLEEALRKIGKFLGQKVEK